MRLRDDVPLPVGVRDLRMGAWDRAEIHRLFDTLEFHPLRERLFAAAVDTGPVDTGFEVDARRLAKGELAGWLAAVPPGRPVALAARLRTHPGQAELSGVGLWAEAAQGAETPAGGGSPGREGSREPGEAAPGINSPPPGEAAPGFHSVWVDLEDEAGPEDLEALGALLQDPDRPKLAHDAKYLYLATWARGWELRGLVMDTALAAYLVLPAQRTYDLADLALRYLRKELRPEGAGGDGRPGRAPSSLWTPPARMRPGPTGACGPRRWGSWPSSWTRSWPPWRSGG